MSKFNQILRRVASYIFTSTLVICISLPVLAHDHPVSIKKVWKTKTNRVMVMAHRGDHTQAPENTIPAYEKAIEAGAHFVEVDVRLTRDNHWVVYHDRKIPIRGGQLRVLSSLTLGEIMDQRIRGAKYSMPDQTVPLLDDVLETLRGKVLVYLDDKMSRPLELAEIVREHKMEDQVIIGVNDYADAILMSEFAKDIAWRGRTRPSNEELDRYIALKPKLLEINSAHMLQPEQVKRIHKAGIKIMVNSLGYRECDKYYTLYLEKIGADIIQTDDLTKLFAFLTQYQMKSTMLIEPIEIGLKTAHLSHSPSYQHN